MAKNYNLQIFGGLMVAGVLFFACSVAGSKPYTPPQPTGSDYPPEITVPQTSDSQDSTPKPTKKLTKSESDDLKAEKGFKEPTDGDSPYLSKVESDPTTASSAPVASLSPPDKPSDDPDADAESRRLFHEESSRGKHRPSEAIHTDTEDVEYYNPNTGTRHQYELEVERNGDGSIVRVDFPNTGWLEIEGQTVDNHDGTETYITSRGYEYTITKPIRSADDN